MTISVVLVDADGVIQQSSPGWRSRWGRLIDDETLTDAFLAEIFEMERPFLCGGEGFKSELAKILERWGCSDCVDEALRIWTMIDPCEEILSIVRSLRTLGLTLGLATNQQAYRFQYMSEELAYADIFDHCFVSCEMGASKPSQAYFQEIIRRVACPARDILFIDDHQSNVDAARVAGMAAEQFSLDLGPDNMRRLLQRHGISVT
jgi:putative hydrolase of the HAD superfamily|tara:strand:+ start:2362 stop:2976 length:615 start_codon:yes stop_codon:yes gene_type:complete